MTAAPDAPAATAEEAAVIVQQHRYDPDDMDAVAAHVAMVCAAARSPPPTHALGTLAVHKAEALLLRRRRRRHARRHHNHHHHHHHHQEDGLALPPRPPPGRNPADRELYLVFLAGDGDDGARASPPLPPPAVSPAALARCIGFGVVAEERRPVCVFWFDPAIQPRTAAPPPHPPLHPAARAAIAQLLVAAHALATRLGRAPDAAAPTALPGADAAYAAALCDPAAERDLCRVAWGRDPHPYLTLELDADAEHALLLLAGEPKGGGKGVGVGAAAATPGFVWTDGGAAYVMDLLRECDYETVMSQSTVNYNEDYVRMLLREPFNRLTRAIRPFTPPSSLSASSSSPPPPPVCWCATHPDLSVGLLATAPAHRNRGLARRCATAVSLAVGAFLRALDSAGVGGGDDGDNEDNDDDDGEGDAWAAAGDPAAAAAARGSALKGTETGTGTVTGVGAVARPHCFILPDNGASLRTMMGIGYRVVEGPMATWMGVWLPE